MQAVIDMQRTDRAAGAGTGVQQHAGIEAAAEADAQFSCAQSAPPLLNGAADIDRAHAPIVAAARAAGQRHLPRALRCRFIPQQDLMAGRWLEHVQRLLAQPAPPERMPTNGADVAAEQILELGT